MTKQVQWIVQDELLWGAAWLYKATKDGRYLHYIQHNTNLGGTTIFRPTMDWDNKYAGVQVLLAEVRSRLLTVLLAILSFSPIGLL